MTLELITAFAGFTRLANRTRVKQTCARVRFPIRLGSGWRSIDAGICYVCLQSRCHHSGWCGIPGGNMLRDFTAFVLGMSLLASSAAVIAQDHDQDHRQDHGDPHVE